MTYIDGAHDWREWLDDHGDADDARKLTVLRSFIFEMAKEELDNSDIGRSWDRQRRAEWLNKKLAKLGITDRIITDNIYVLSAPVSGKVTMTVGGDDRAEALREFKERLEVLKSRNPVVTNVEATDEPTFESGPEDGERNVVPDDAPQTVDATLAVLQETIALATISGPHICVPGANEVLDDFGLPHLPERKTFVVTRPAGVVLKTVVEAFDEASALRVAGWRWEDARTSYEILGEAAATGDLAVGAPAS